ncbi:esterase/lipase family protein [Tessaracoccus lacteus]|uniref:Alpha/beta hydrolase n=1 Tax=Tessaracoccus lacteus TaxID=3041766 RepID=A0ABY8PZ53_9ACTN|nr:hypothetical protein [Tessaracoccus sp. T21]WGT47805.1 hypothetical protein QH948_03240 [Tessaracoccus sp. T21]
MPIADGLRVVARRGWFWGADYRYVAWALGGGLMRRAVPARYADGDGRPVVLLPGVLEDWTMMRPVAEALHAAGHPVHTLPELRRNTATLADGAVIAAAYLAARDLTDVVLVAHSKGGLVGKLVMLGEEGRRVHSLVAVATPFAGSSLARLIPWRVVSSLSPADAAIVDLGARSEVNDRITSISPAFDPHIPGGSHLPGAVNVEVAAMGHFRILSDADTLAAVVDAASC